LSKCYREESPDEKKAFMLKISELMELEEGYGSRRAILNLLYIDLEGR
jgi:hypothetical protein